MCRKWKQGVKQSLGRRESLSFAGWKMDDDSTARQLRHAYSLKDLDMYVICNWILSVFHFCYNFLNFRALRSELQVIIKVNKKWKVKETHFAYGIT